MSQEPATAPSSEERAGVLEEPAGSAIDLQAQFDALHQEMEQRVTEAEQRRIDLETQLEVAQTSIQGLSQQLADAANQQAEALKRAVIAENAGQVIPELVQGDNSEEIESSVTLARAA